MEKDRLLWLDISKGIAIILMVLGHSSLPSNVQNFIYSFHMPLFFIASGWTTNWNKYSYYGFLASKFRSLVLPFLKYSLIVAVALFLIDKFDFIQWLKYGWGGIALWFIPVLFISLLISKLIIAIPYRTLKLTLWLSMAVIGYILNILHIQLPWTMTTVPYATFLIIGGGGYARYFQNLINSSTICYYLIISFIITLFISHYCRLDMCYNCITPIIPITIAAFSGVTFVFIVATFIAREGSNLSKILCKIGRETYIILAFSQIIIMILNQYFILNPLVKYLILIIILFVLIKFKGIVSRYL